MRVLVVNHAGDVREAYFRLSEGGAETYYAQRYFMDAYAGLRDYASEVAVLACTTDTYYDELLPNGVRAVGGGLKNVRGLRPMLRLVRDINPTHIVVTSPDWRFVRWLATQRYTCLAAFANSVPTVRGNPIRRAVARVRNAQLAFCLNRDRFPWIGSYGMTSARRLAELGVDTGKIIPWDMLIDSDSGQLPPKSLRTLQGDCFKVCYVGSIQASKGVGDLIEAVARLRRSNFPVKATIIGLDSDGFVKAQIRKHAAEEFVETLGIVPNDRLELAMHNADVMVVPSRFEFPEGFPLVIHHALRSRTPIVASSHPMFRDHLKHRENAMIFAASDPAALAEAVRELLSYPRLYERLSQASDSTWLKMRLSVKWAELARHWLSGKPEDQAWLSSQALG